MKIKGLQKLTLLDFPDRIACTVFLGGCNFRCPFCHNSSLVLPRGNDEEISEEEFFSFLKSRVGRLYGVCVSGGEPTLYENLPELIRKIRLLGYAVKLDTNGYRPDVISALINEGLLDYVAMDIKSSPEGYSACVGIKDFDISPIYKSIELLSESGVPYEFRTTVVRELHTEADILAIGEWLRGDVKLYLQSFKDSGDIISEGLSAYSDEEMRYFEKILREYIPRTEWRG